MLRQKIAPYFRCSLVLATLASTACLPLRRGSSTKNSDGENRNEIMTKYIKALNSAAALNLSYSPLWLLADGSATEQACYLSDGIRDDDNSYVFSLRAALPCALADGKTPANVWHMDSFHSRLRAANDQSQVGLLNSLPLLGPALPACKDNSTTVVKRWQDIPGSESFSDSVQQAMTKAAYTNITLVKGRALVLASHALGIDIFPAPAICGLSTDLSKISGDEATKSWANGWAKLVQTDDSLYHDTYYLNDKLLNASYNLWYRQFARLSLGQKWKGGALDFQANESEAEASRRIKDHLSQYLNDSLIGEISLIPTLHPDEKGKPHCFSWTPVSKLSAEGRRLHFDSNVPWVSDGKARRFKDLNFPTIFFQDKDQDAPGADASHSKHFQLRYALGQFGLADKSDTALLSLALNSGKQGHPVCYSENGQCGLFIGPASSSNRSCLDFLKSLWP